MDYLIIGAAVLGIPVLGWPISLLILYYLLRYQYVQSIYLATNNNQFKEMVNTTATHMVTVGKGLKKFQSPTRVLLFPDSKVPCESYIKSFKPNAGSNIKCFKKYCDMFHYNDVEKSSYMTILESLRGACQLDLCMYKITLREASEVLISLHQSDARVRIITEPCDPVSSDDQVPRLRRSGIKVCYITGDSSQVSEREKPIMHNKFVIIDHRMCFLGSFNWTWKALTKNEEMVIECHEPAVVSKLVKNFQQLWDAFEDENSKIRQLAESSSSLSSQANENLDNLNPKVESPEEQFQRNINFSSHPMSNPNSLNTRPNCEGRTPQRLRVSEDGLQIVTDHLKS